MLSKIKLGRISVCSAIKYNRPLIYPQRTFATQIRVSKSLASGQILSVRNGDITREDCEAIVNAANGYLRHGGGVAAAISRAGGPIIQQESTTYVESNGSIPTGKVAVTSGGNLRAKYVIHTVGPVWQGGYSNEPTLLKEAVWNSLIKANSLNVKSIALPAISSGIYGFPKDRCASIMIATALEFCTKHSLPTDIRFTNFDELTVSVFEHEFKQSVKS